MDIIIIVFIFIVILLIIKIIFDIKEQFEIPEYLKHKTKCFSCEKQVIQMYGEDAAWFGQPSKSFDSELDGINQKNDIAGGFLGKTMKYY